jgi:hypothetical protein
MDLRLTSTAVGCTTFKGDFAALIHKLRFDNGDTVLTSWSIDACARLIAVLSQHLNPLDSIAINTAAEDLFQSKEGRLTQAEVEMPGLDSVVGEILGVSVGRELHVTLRFTNSGDAKVIVLGLDEARCLMGYSGNTLQHAGVLEKVVVASHHYVQPITLFTCSFSSGGEKIHHTRNEDIDPNHYNLLPNLYSVTVVDNSNPAKKQVVGGFLLKTIDTSGQPGFQNSVLEIMSSTPGFITLEKSKISYVTVRMGVSDGGQMTEKEMLHHFIEQYTTYSVTGNA